MATFNQAQKLLSVFESLETESMQKVLESGILAVVRDKPELIQKFLDVARGLAEIVMKPVLELVKPDIAVSACEKFVVADYFKEGNAGIYHLSDKFKKWFLNRVEYTVPATTLSSHVLKSGATDGSIKAELGEGHEIFLVWLFEQIVAQADGREGELLIGNLNIFYITDRVVRVNWANGFGWNIYAYDALSSLAWSDGSRVFSRNSVIASSGSQAKVQF